MSDDLTSFYDAVGTSVSFDDSATYAANPGLPETKPDVPTGPVSAWAVNGDQHWGISESIATVPPGCYRTGWSDGIGAYISKQRLQTDALLTLPDSKSEAVVAEIEEFTTLRPAFVQRGLLYKRGVLLWGPPGSGKTSTLHLLMRIIVERLGGIALILENPSVAAGALQLIRKIEPNRLVIGLLEDIDTLVGNYGPSGYLSLLDGESQVDNIVFVATTNYPERLDRRFVDRPSRFDTVEYVGMPSAEARRVYLLHKEPGLSEAMLDEMVASTEGLSIAHLREMIILTQCFGRSVEDAAKRLNASKHKTPDSERPPGAETPGFGASRRISANWNKRIDAALAGKNAGGRA